MCGVSAFFRCDCRKVFSIHLRKHGGRHLFCYQHRALRNIPQRRWFSSGQNLQHTSSDIPHICRPLPHQLIFRLHENAFKHAESCIAGILRTFTACNLFFHLGNQKRICQHGNMPAKNLCLAAAGSPTGILRLLDGFCEMLRLFIETLQRMMQPIFLCIGIHGFFRIPHRLPGVCQNDSADSNPLRNRNTFYHRFHLVSQLITFIFRRIPLQTWKRLPSALPPHPGRRRRSGFPLRILCRLP